MWPPVNEWEININEHLSSGNGNRLQLSLKYDETQFVLVRLCLCWNAFERARNIIQRKLLKARHKTLFCVAVDVYYELCYKMYAQFLLFVSFECLAADIYLIFHSVHFFLLFSSASTAVFFSFLMCLVVVVPLHLLHIKVFRCNLDCERDRGGMSNQRKF